MAVVRYACNNNINDDDTAFCFLLYTQGPIQTYTYKCMFSMAAMLNNQQIHDARLRRE